MPSSAPAEEKIAFGFPVIKEIKAKISTQTGNPLAPVCNSDLSYLIYQQTSTEIDMKTISFAPDQDISDDF